MNHTAPILRYFSILFAATLLTGCGGSWLKGKWILDEQRTVNALSPGDTTDREEKGLLGKLADSIEDGISHVLLASYRGTIFEFTGEELLRIKDGTGESRPYEIIERPDPDTCVLKFADGEIATWNRVEGGIRRKLPGEKSAWVYFAPVED